MSPIGLQNTPDHAPTVEEGLQAMLQDGKRSLKQRYHALETEVARHPTKAVLCATAAGYLLNRLPLRSILVANVRIAAALTPPLLLAIGAAKACEFLQSKARMKRF